MLLLLERSVIAIGERSEEVSSCAFAIAELLKPHSWPSIFTPSLTDETLEIISSPVPIAAGAARSKDALPQIEAMGEKEMVAAANLNRGKVSFSEEAAAQNNLLQHVPKTD